jgi:hypothetical protein
MHSLVGTYLTPQGDQYIEVTEAAPSQGAVLHVSRGTVKGGETGMDTVPVNDCDGLESELHGLLARGGRRSDITVQGLRGPEPKRGRGR